MHFKGVGQVILLPTRFQIPSWKQSLLPCPSPLASKAFGGTWSEILGEVQGRRAGRRARRQGISGRCRTWGTEWVQAGRTASRERTKVWAARTRPGGRLLGLDTGSRGRGKSVGCGLAEERCYDELCNRGRSHLLVSVLVSSSLK